MVRTVESAEGHAVDRFRGEAGCSAKEMAVVASDNDSVGDSSTQCSDVIDDDDNEEEETDVEESGAGGWIMNPPVSTIVQKHQAFDTTNGYIALPNPDSSNFSDVRVKESRNVHLGSEVNYNGSVTIHVKHVVYTSSLSQDASKSDTSVSDNTSNLSTNKDNGDINRCIFRQNIKLNKVTQGFWTWKRAVLSCVITLILLAVVMSITVHFTHKSDASVFSEIPISSLEDPDKVSPLSGYYKVVCYFTNWAWYRRGIGRYLPEHIDHTLCTHIVYGFAMLDYSELVIKTNDSWADYDNRFYERVVAYKKRGLKVLLALGGWNDSAGDKYSRLVNSPSARKKFINHAIQFIEKYGFDGLDLDWEYPVCWQANCNKGPDSDKESFAAILQELSAKFKPKGLLLSAAVSPNILVIDKGYDVPALAKYLDWIAVMAYDYHGQWDKRTGHVAPLYYHPDDEFYYLNANYSINYWISKGAPPRSIVMGMPLYGHSFSIHDPRAGTGLNSPASAGNAGEFTGIAGFLSYYEICERVRNRGWTVVQDPEGRMGPYAYNGSQWVSFDDSEMIRRKAQFVRDMSLGGGMVWALDLDDFRGQCDNGPHPLMHTIQRVLAEPPKEHDRPLKPVESKPPPPKMTTWTVKPMQAIQTTTTVDRVSHDSSSEFKVICYFTNWAWYRQEGGRFVPEDIDSDLCTHVLYGFSVLDGSSLTMKSNDPTTDIDKKFYERVAVFKAKGLKVLMALGGWNDSADDKYSRLVNSPSARRRFITQVLVFIEKYGFEGLDLDWKYPVCWQADCNKGPESDKQNFAELVKELSNEFKPRGLLLSAVVSPSKRVIDAGYDVPILSKYLDWISVMTYNFHGQWDNKTGHVAPLYSLPNDWKPTSNANFSIHYWIEKGANPKKLIMGAPLYGQSFSLAERNVHGLNAPTYGGGETGEATRTRGFLSYYEICERTLKKGWTVAQDKDRRIGPFAYKGDQWVSFDDAQQIKLKAELIKKLGLGGGMVWALELDDFKNRCGCEPNPLLRTMNRVLRNYPKGPLCPITEGTGAVTTWPTQAIQTTTTVDRVSHDSFSEFKVICYFANWAWYRQEGGRFVPEDIDSDLCTHVLYGFSMLDGNSLTMKSNDPTTDIDKKFYERVAAFKAKGLKVLMALGGWNDSVGDKYSRLVNSPSARRRFITQVLVFIEKYGFEGLDLDWKYPVCWQVDCNKGPESDKQSFAELVKELSNEFKPRGLLLSAAVSPSKRVIDAGYDVPILSKYLDWISVMTYDFHGQWDKKTGHVAPLYSLPNDWKSTANANFSIHYWIEKGANPKKLIMGVPLYGQSFSLSERNVHGLNASTYGGGEAGESTRARGFLSYYEICERTLKKGWTVVQDKDRRIGPYAYKGDQWVSFDDAQQIKLKAELIKKLGLGGGMVWALDLDDFKNRCGCEPSPLLRTMNRVLRNYPKGPLCPITEGAIVIDVSQTDIESTERPIYESTTSSRPI